jgi:hypothetical protein
LLALCKLEFMHAEFPPIDPALVETNSPTPIGNWAGSPIRIPSDRNGGGVW